MSSMKFSRNYEAVKRWRERHRGLCNLRQREYRRKKKGVPLKDVLPIAEALVEDHDPRNGKVEARIYDKAETLRVLREMVAREEDVRRVKVEAIPGKIYYDAFGRRLTAEQWVAMKQREEDARVRGYEIDTYSQ